MAANYFRYAKFADVKAIHDACVAAFAEGSGSTVVSISGGGENETRQVTVNVQSALAAAQRELSRRDPETYPPIPYKAVPNFSVSPHP